MMGKLFRWAKRTIFPCRTCKGYGVEIMIKRVVLWEEWSYKICSECHAEGVSQKVIDGRVEDLKAQNKRESLHIANQMAL